MMKKNIEQTAIKRNYNPFLNYIETVQFYRFFNFLFLSSTFIFLRIIFLNCNLQHLSEHLRINSHDLRVSNSRFLVKYNVRCKFHVSLFINLLPFAAEHNSHTGCWRMRGKRTCASSRVSNNNVYYSLP